MNQSDVLELCGDLHDGDAASMQLKVIKYLEKHTKSECCALLVVSEDTTELFCQVIGNKLLEPEVRFAIPTCCLSAILISKKTMKLADIGEAGRLELSQRLGLEVKCAVFVPVVNLATGSAVGIACAFNKKNNQSYTPFDEDVITQCFRYTIPVLTSTLALQMERKLKQETQSLLQIAKNLFTHLDDDTLLLREIMQEARNLTQAERCSLFLVEKDMLVAKVFDGNVKEDCAEVRFPINQGIAGHVATTGKTLNIKDAYSHPLFYAGVDKETGFKTKNILCFPIMDNSTSSSKIIGIAELCNKIDGLYFTKHDEEVASAFSVYCGISIVQSLLYTRMKDAQYRSKLSNELMMYHMKRSEGVVTDEDGLLYSEEVKPILFYDPLITNFTYSPRGIPDQETILVCLSMFDDMGLLNSYRIDKRTLTNFFLMVKKGYRDPPYHNWYHAFTVGHFCYLLYKNINSLNSLREIEILALFVACLCHDLDHRGTNNSFQVHSDSVLAALYSSEGSVMERHHFAQAMCILNTEGCNIFETLSRQDYQEVLDLMQDIILATDLAHHLRIIKDLKKIAKEGYKKEDARCRKLLLCLLMTSCDLSDQTKGWKTTKKIAELIYREFFTQGDLEKAIGIPPLEMYDREKAFIPELQLNFLDHIARPVYQILADIFPEAQVLLNTVDGNRNMWIRLRDESKQRRLSSTNSLDFFDMQFHSETPALIPEENNTDSSIKEEQGKSN
ncbi:cGMP-dependent 3',5'-cyclic phosphodiesterase-like isoform X1 [Anneissia japonica]|uniref:cGMP-dependent 3',5'-cyclic phosphodiesterase-like isoform X1 n=1 Tax=Anneissia japonica TaxID=1529436 RepID=UPI001425A764|nr:cGMP-dependent 3',5'-cyclic phosphodiesterase-like isoform X1 [Anneissia japonica]